MVVELLFLAVLGLAVGSFLTLVVGRLDTAESIWFGRSHCDHCKKPLRWWELIPLVSYVIIQGKCPRCEKQISHVYPIFEAIAGIVFVLIGIGHPSSVTDWYLAGELIIASLLLLLFFYDWLNQSFPAFVLYKTAALVIILSVVKSTTHYPGSSLFILDPLFHWLSAPQPLWWNFVLGGLVGGGALGLLAFPSRGQWMGYGDVILSAILGLWLGFPAIIIALFIAFYAGAIVGGAQLWLKKAAKDHRIAFGPFLIFGAFIAYAYGDVIIRSLLRWWGVV